MPRSVSISADRATSILRTVPIKHGSPQQKVEAIIVLVWMLQRQMLFMCHSDALKLQKYIHLMAHYHWFHLSYYQKCSYINVKSPTKVKLPQKNCCSIKSQTAQSQFSQTVHLIAWGSSLSCLQPELGVIWCERLRHVGNDGGFGWNNWKLQGEMGIYSSHILLSNSNSVSYYFIFRAVYDRRQEGSRVATITSYMSDSYSCGTWRAIGRWSDIYWTTGPNNDSENRILQYWLGAIPELQEAVLVPLGCEDDPDRILKLALRCYLKSPAYKCDTAEKNFISMTLPIFQWR